MRPVCVALCLLFACAENPRSETSTGDSAERAASKATRAEAGAASPGVAADAGVEPDPIAAECVGRRSGESFCADSEIRVCTDFVPSSLLTCGPERRCVMLDGQASCVCAPGAVETNGQCSPVDDCAHAQGGCDPLTTCSMQGGRRTCGACPAGYSGSGESGCAPLLRSLAVEEGALEPAFSPAVMSYRVQLSTSREQLVVRATAVADAAIEINGAEIAADGTWTSPMLPTGKQTIAVTVTSRVGITTRYDIVAERATP